MESNSFCTHVRWLTKTHNCSVTDNINHNYNKICDILKHKIFESFLPYIKKAIQVHVCNGSFCPIPQACCVVSTYTVILMLIIRAADSQSD